MGRCKHIYRMGFKGAKGPHAETRCVLQAHPDDVNCLVEEPLTYMHLYVSPVRSHNLLLDPQGPRPYRRPKPSLLPRPQQGPFGPEMRLPARWATWTELEQALRAERALL
jgi:hypothetical protein